MTPRSHIQRYPLKGKNAQFSLRVAVKDNRRCSPHLNDIINLRREPNMWRIFLHGQPGNHFFVKHQGTLKSAIATYVMLRA
jgi:hypothetical protein